MAQIPEMGSFRVGEWSVRRTEGTLCSETRSVRVEPRVMDVLVYLAVHADRVVTKDEIMQAVWNGTFVEEGALTQAVHSLRKALGDDARQPRYIQTIPKRGFRLVAPVLPATDDAEEGREEHEEPKVGPALPQQLVSPDPPELAPDVLTGGGRRFRRPLVLMAVASALIAIAVLLVWSRLGDIQTPLPEEETPSSPALRIVVLPFENIGRSEDAYFADGLTEEITKDLASLPALQVISRTSALRYAGTRQTLPEIGRELKVDYVLEGTVRWAAGPGGLPRVRITPQLIRVADDAHVWADSFERKVNDIFQVQTEISRRVISRLGVTLMPEEKQALAVPPTDNLEAYQAYLRGLNLTNQPFFSERHVESAIPMFERAVELDPGFAAAWARLSQDHSYLAFNSDRSPERVEKARKALERAEALSPDLPAVRLARAYFTYRCRQDFDAALNQLTALARLSPNDPEVLQTLGFVLRRQGRLAEAIDQLQHAFALDPRTVKLVWAIAETYRALRDYEQADRYYAEAIALAPDEETFWEERTLNRLAWTGEVADARAVLAEAPIPDEVGLIPVAFQLDLYERKYESALARLSPDKMKDLTLIQQARLITWAAIVRERLGDHRGALATAEANRVILERWMEQYPDAPLFRAYLAVALAQLGREAEAVGQAERAVRQKHHDFFTGPRVVEVQAMVDAVLGRRREAVEKLNRLLATSFKSAICVAELRLDPIWETLRGDPRFEALLRSYGD